MTETAIRLARGLDALRWLDGHADTTVHADFTASERCLPCCKFTVALLRGQLPAEAEHLRCAEAQDRLRLVRDAYELVPDVLGREEPIAARPEAAEVER